MKYKFVDNIKSKRAITLISLVITIIVLTVLAGVVINTTIGNNGLFTLAKKQNKIWKIQ